MNNDIGCLELVDINVESRRPDGFFYKCLPGYREGVVIEWHTNVCEIFDGEEESCTVEFINLDKMIKALEKARDAIITYKGL